MVDAELRLEPVCGSRTDRGRHDPRVVDQHVDGVVAGLESFSKARHRAEFGKVEKFEADPSARRLRADPAYRCNPLYGIPPGEDHVAARVRQRQCGLEAEAARTG